MSTIRYDPRILMYLNDEWKDVHRQTRIRSGVEWFVGREDESGEPDPGWCKFTLDNSDGAFTPRNPMSPYAGSLNVNTPMCLIMDEVTDDFDRTSVDSWGVSTTGDTYSTTGAGGTFAPGDFDVASGEGIHHVPTTSAYRTTYFTSSSGAPLAHNTMQRVRFRLSISDITGGEVEPGNLLCRMTSANTYYMCRLVINTDESVTVAILRNQSTVLASATVVPGVTHTASQGIWVKFAAIDDELMATAWVGDDPEDEPMTWLVTASDTTHTFGRYGIRSGVAAGNTNVKPVDFYYSDYTVWISQFNGEIPEFPQEFSDDNQDQIVPCEAGGLIRRYSEGKGIDFRTIVRRHYESTFDEPPDWYWPLDDGELSRQGRATVFPTNTGPEIGFRLTNANLGAPDDDPSQCFGQAKLAPWMDQGVNLSPSNPTFFVSLPKNADDVGGSVTWDWILRMGSNTEVYVNMVGRYSPGVTHAGLTTDAVFMWIDVPSNLLRLTPGYDETELTYGISMMQVNVADGAWHWFRFRTISNGSGGVFWRFVIDGELIDDGTITPHPMIASVAGFTILNANPDNQAKDVGLSSVAVWHTGTDPIGSEQDTYNILNGRQGETAKARAIRLMDEEGVPHFMTGTGGREMGPQSSDLLLKQLFEVMNTDGGLLRELTTARGLHYNTLSELRAFEVVCTIDVSNEELGPGFQPVDDSQQLRNRVRALKRYAGDYTSSRDTGRLGTADPKLGGAGVYRGGDIAANPDLEGDLIPIAERETARGTVDKARFPELNVNLNADIIRSDMVLRRSILDLGVASRLVLTNMQASHVYEDANLMVVGMTNYATNHEYRKTFNTIPYDSFEVFRVETAGSILGTDSTVLCDDIDDNDTTARIVTEGNALWTVKPASFPFTVRIGIPPSGEDVSITNCETVAPDFISAGVASHGDNSTRTPGLPGVHSAGDTLILVTAIRNTSALADTPVGWESIQSSGHFKVCAKISTGGSEVAPSCTYSGGAAGDTTSAVIMSFSDMPFDYDNAVTVAGASNASAQNIALPPASIPRCNGLALALAWKQDDYTSIAVPQGFAECGEWSTTAGNDQSLYAAYRQVPYTAGSPVVTLAVTGGGAAISKGFMIHFANPQTITFTRSLNGVVREWTAGTQLRVAYPKVLG